MTKRAPEDPVPNITSFYSELLEALQQTHVRRGKAKMMQLEGDKRVLAVEWMGADQSDLAMVNFGAEMARIPVKGTRVLYVTEPEAIAFGADYVELQPKRAAIIRMEPRKIG
jgi:hypothetical protein